MNTLLTLLTICLVVIIYMHVVFQLTTSNDLEIFELETPSKIKLEEVCNLHQPFLFFYQNDSLSIFQKLMEYKTFELKKEYDALQSHSEDNREYNKFLLKKELVEHEYLKENDEDNNSLYPNLYDPQFNI